MKYDNTISVILPTYNGAEYIRGSIDSIISQTYEDWELIIVNDCSNDNTLDIINEYAAEDKRIRVISNDVNKKLPASLNTGFAEAKGEYLTWTSDDNEYHNDAFSCLIKEINNSEDIDLVYSDYDHIDTNGVFIEHVIKPEPDELRYNNCIGACFLYRKSLADRIGEYDTGLFLAEDYEYWIRAYMNGGVRHVNKILYDYRLHDASLTSTKNKEVQKVVFMARNKHFDELLKKCITQEERNKLYDEMLHNLLDNKEKKKYRKQYYSMDHRFAVHDMRNRIINTYHFIRSSCSRRVKRVLRHIDLYEG